MNSPAPVETALTPATKIELARLRRALIDIYVAGGMETAEAEKYVDSAVAGGTERFVRENPGAFRQAWLIEVIQQSIKNFSTGKETDPKWTLPANAIARARKHVEEIELRRQRIQERLH